MVAFQHDGTGSIKYSFLGSALPTYVSQIDTNNDDLPDRLDVLNLGFSDDIFAIELDDTLSVPDLSFTAEQQAGIIRAIGAWNEVANTRLEPGTSEAFSGAATGLPVTGSGALVNGLGGASGYGERVLPRNDDGSRIVDIRDVFEGGLDFFGGTYSQIYVNTNGSISFESEIGTFTPETITGGTTPIIAPFWADIDTNIDSDPDTPDSGAIYVDVDDLNDVVTITWDQVGYYDETADLTNSFQLQLFDRGGGSFGAVFRYADINWTTGDASNGSGGLGGTPARMGYSAGNSTDFFELPQSGNQNAVLSLDTTPGNTGVNGLWEFEVRNGGILGDIVFAQADLLLAGSFAQEAANTFGNAYFEVGNSQTSSSDQDVFGIDGDVYFDRPEDAPLDFSFGTANYQSALEAVGEALGFSREDSPSSRTLFGAIPTEPFYLTPLSGDIFAAQEIYGPNWLTRAEDTTYFGVGGTYELDSRGFLSGEQTRAWAAIWDGGGTDLIDLSHFEVDVLGSAQPDGALAVTPEDGFGSVFVEFASATYSDPAVRDLGFAPSNLIENLRLGSGDDRVLGSNWENLIEGGLGNDHLEGLAGDDFIHGGYFAPNRPDSEVLDGNDTLDGGEGIDTAVFGNPNVYTLVLSPDEISMQNRAAGGTGVDTLLNIETLLFDDDRFDVFETNKFELARFDGVTRIAQPDLLEIVELYIAYFNRAPDAMGLLFWADAFADESQTLEQVAAGFIDQDETRALYPEGEGNASFINAVYQNVLGRDVDGGGLTFWQGQLEDGSATRDTFILDILRGAKADAPDDASEAFIALQDTDQAYLLTKTDIGSYFAIHKGMSNVENARDVMQLFTREDLDDDPAVAAIDQFATVSEDDTFGDFLVQVQGILDNPFG